LTLSNLLIQAVAQSITFNVKIELRLQVQPEPLGGPEISSQSQGRVRRNRTLPVHDLVYTARGNTDVHGAPVLTDSHGNKELLEQDLSCMDRCQLLWCHHYLLVVIDYLYVVCISLAPSKADAPLIVDPNAVLTSAVAPQPFQAVARRHAKIRQTHGRIQHAELPQRHSLNSRPELPDRLSLEEPIGVLIPKALDHAVA
jgi:hypothetical protein